MPLNPKGALYVRVEVAVRPDLPDPKADLFLHQVDRAYPELRKQIRWARFVQIYWLKMECTREELIFAIGEVFLDKTLQWLMTGNLIPSAGGKLGTAEDLLQFAPVRPGRFWGLEKRLRAGGGDAAASAVMEAFEIVLKKKLTQSQISTGEMIILEGKELQTSHLEYLANKIFVNEQLETWTIQEENELLKNNRFHQERIRHDFPKVFISPLSLNRKTDPKHVKELFQIKHPKNLSQHWFKKNNSESLLEWSEDLLLNVSTFSFPKWVSVDVFGGTHRTVLQSVLQASCAGLGAKPISILTGTALLETKNYGKSELAPTVVMDQMHRGVALGGHQLGIPLETAEVLYSDEVEVPGVFSTVVSRTPFQSFEKFADKKEIKSGDRLLILGAPTLKDQGVGVLSATHRSNGLILKRMIDFIVEARDLGFFRTLVPVGEAGLGAAFTQLGLLAGGVRVDFNAIPKANPSMGIEEVLASPCPERILFAVPAMHASSFEGLCLSRKLNAAWVGECTQTQSIELYQSTKLQQSSDEAFLWPFTELIIDDPTLVLADVNPEPTAVLRSNSSDMPKMNDRTGELICQLLRSKNILSRQQWYRNWDREVQGTSVIQSYWGKMTEVFGFVSQLSSSQQDGISGASVLASVNNIELLHRTLDWTIARTLSLGGEFGNSESRFFIQMAAQGNVKILSLLEHWANQWSQTYNIVLDWAGSKPTEALGCSLHTTAISKMTDVKIARSPDFKQVGDVIYILGGIQLGLVGSEYERIQLPMPVSATQSNSAWDLGIKTYSWLGGLLGRSQLKLKSCYPVQTGGVVITLAKALVGRDLGAQIDIPDDREPWTFCFGEGMHTLLVSFSEQDAKAAENEWIDLNLPFYRLGSVTSAQKLRVNSAIEPGFIISMDKIRESFMQSGVWV